MIAGVIKGKAINRKTKNNFIRVFVSLSTSTRRAKHQYVTVNIASRRPGAISHFPNFPPDSYRDQNCLSFSAQSPARSLFLQETTQQAGKQP